MLDAAHRTDGPRHHLDIGAALPPLDGIVATLDSLSSGPGAWRAYLRAVPGWWSYSEDRRRKWPPVSVHAEDDVGGSYLSIFGGSNSHDDCEELTLNFLPRLNPLARALKLTFGAGGEVEVDVDLISAADRK
ncbi:MAG: hypothetical protein M3Y33_10780 [Actinomycetota bacterium]|nr:hypothetical protein [Actinomycetota bacterium]